MGSAFAPQRRRTATRPAAARTVRRGPSEPGHVRLPRGCGGTVIAGPTLRWLPRKGIGRFPDRRPRWPDPERDLTPALLDLPGGPAENRPTTQRRTTHTGSSASEMEMATARASRSTPLRVALAGAGMISSYHLTAWRNVGPRAGSSRWRIRTRAARGARRGVRHPERLPGRGLDARERRARRARRRLASRDPRRLGRGGRRAGRGRPLPEAAHADAGGGRGARRRRGHSRAPHGPRELAVPALVSRARAVDRRRDAGRDRARPARDDLLGLPARRRGAGPALLRQPFMAGSPA